MGNVSEISVNFKNVEVRKGPRSDRVPPQDYLAEVLDADRVQNKDKSGYHIVWTLGIVKPKAQAGKRQITRTSLKDENLWQLRSFLIDLMGEEAAPQKSKLKIPIAKIIRKKMRIGITVQDTEPNENDKVYSEVVAHFPASDFTEAGTAKSEKTKKKSKKAEPVEDEDEDEDEDEEEESDDDEEEESDDDDDDEDEIDVDDI